MNQFRQLKFIAWLLSLLISLFPMKGIAEDIDIFVGSSSGTKSNPNVLIVLDNTSNWSRASQKWPEGEEQGQSEVSAIKSVIEGLDDQVNVGLMTFVTGGTANDNGGYIRYAIRPMNSTNKTAFSSTLTTIYNNITSPEEKRNSGTAYGNLMYDIYNYFAGRDQSQAGAGTVTTLADSEGYSTSYSKFKSPTSCDTNCAKNFVIFVSNPDASGPTHDDSPFTPGNTTALSGVGGNTSQLGLPVLTTTTTATQSTLGKTASCYADAASCTSAGVASFAPSLTATCSNASLYSGGCSCGSAEAASPVCAAGTQRYAVTRSIPKDTVVSSWVTKDCYASVATPGTTAPSGFPTTTGVSKETDSCPSGTYNYFASKAGPGSGSCKSKYTYTVQCKQTAASTPEKLGYTSSCYPDTGTCSTTDYAASCTSPYGCSCNGSDSVTSLSCAAGTSLFTVVGNSSTTSVKASGTYATDTAPYNADEWSRHLYQKGVNVGDCDNIKVITYAIDVYNAQPNTTHTALMYSMARVGGGKYFTANNKDKLKTALQQIFQEIQSVNSTFASASLPINATNRSVNQNQVFIGMFRPDPETRPRWFGNVKRYKLITDSGGNLQLGDKNGNVAINLNTGFITECAASFWTSESPNAPGKTDNSGYWSQYTISPTPISACGSANYGGFSDMPDGPSVEKGAAAEVIRKGNNPESSNTSPTWQENRTIYTRSGSSLVEFTTASSGLSDTLVKWIRGQDTEDENGNGSLGSQSPTAYSKETRASLHGDVVHSRPLPVTYSASSTVIYYGANDGSLRAIDAGDPESGTGGGKEYWSFIPPEFFSKLDRLRTQSPLVCYPGQTGMSYDSNGNCTSGSPTPTKRDYFFDGSIGVYQNSDNSNVWIFPTMRRGGRMVYALDVKTPASPSLLWKFGCTSLTSDTECSDTDIGQTWSIPNVAFIKGYSTTTPVAAFGGGYDTCYDENSASPGCGSTPKGNAIYVLNAENGSLIKKFSTKASVVSDVAFIDLDFDNKPDFAYAADLGGNLYRLNFSDYDPVTNTYTSRTPGSWSITRVAYNNKSGVGKKFMYAPALFGGSGKIFVALGAGDREHPLPTQYPYTSSLKNYFYVYRDCLPSPIPSADSLTGGDDLNDASKMNMSSATAPASCDAAKTLGSNCTDNKGWAIQLNNGKGEQTVTSALISGGMVTFSTNRPIPPETGTCGTALGEARGYWLDLYNGSGAIGVDGSCGGATSAAFVGGGLPPSPVAGTVLVDGKPTSVVIGAVQKSGGASSPISPQKASATNLPARKRVYTIIKGEN